MTYMKIANLIVEMVGGCDFLKMKGVNLHEMNLNIYRQLEDELIKKFKNKEELKLTLGEKIVPMTIYTFFSSKADCLAFIKELKKESGQKGDIDVREGKELRVTVSGIVRLICHW